jgi:hypothetical protein
MSVYLSNLFRANCQKNQTRAEEPYINNEKYSCFEMPNSTKTKANTPIVMHESESAKAAIFPFFIINICNCSLSDI